MTTVRVSTNKLDGRFDGVARLIAEGDPPPWLVAGLEHFSQWIGVEITAEERRHFESVVEQMQGSIQFLMRWLPMYVHAGYGEKCPDDVALALYVLPKVKAHLDLLPDDRVGRRPDHQHEICAAIVVESWGLVRGKVQPRSDELMLACRDYWIACGGKGRGEIDDLDNWKRDIERAIKTNHKWIRDFLKGLQNHPERVVQNPA
jgi:hypothetical protein